MYTLKEDRTLEMRRCGAKINDGNSHGFAIREQTGGHDFQNTNQSNAIFMDNCTASPTHSLPEPPRAHTKVLQSVRITTPESAAPSRCFSMTTRRHSVTAISSHL
ncbi:hypothetical protein PoB_005342500 [Plakobranchus ocellatus]|uniref:Uncharacterized protein n=1 Tax=Plakobranchus ocellatus TaxID=259542 RepID=A0AAV4C2L7_9GAST|nr:hypothetical protein PoB_005342500 [Plakobranchus ocellatus]